VWAETTALSSFEEQTIMNSYSLIDKSMRKTFIELIDFKFAILINNKEAKYSYLK